jgi:hypothetical protein
MIDNYSLLPREDFIGQGFDQAAEPRKLAHIPKEPPAGLQHNELKSSASPSFGFAQKGPKISEMIRWIPVSASRSVHRTIAEIHAEDPIQIQWSYNEGATKKFPDHHNEIETKALDTERRVSKQLERQKVIYPAFVNQPIVALPQPKLATSQNSSSSNHVHSKNCVNYKPHTVIKAGFGNSPDSGKPFSTDYIKDFHLVDRYKFLKYPEPQSSSIVFHSLQGDLIRKRQSIAHQKNHISTNSQSSSNQVEEPGEKISVCIDPSQTPLANMDRADSYVDVSHFYQQQQAPSILEDMYLGLKNLVKPDLPLFWKVC